MYRKNAQWLQSDWWQDIKMLPRSFLIFLVIVFIFDVGSFNKLLLIARAQEILQTGSIARSAQLIVLLYAIFNSVRSCAEFILGLVSDYINRSVLLAIVGCGTLAITAWLLMIPHASLSYCALIFALSAMSTAPVTTLKKACAADMLPTPIRGLGFGLLQAGEGFASLVANILIGSLWTYYSVVLAFSYVVVLSLLAMVLLLCFGIYYRRAY